MASLLYQGNQEKYNSKTKDELITSRKSTLLFSLM